MLGRFHTRTHPSRQIEEWRTEEELPPGPALDRAGFIRRVGAVTGLSWVAVAGGAAGVLLAPLKAFAQSKSGTIASKTGLWLGNVKTMRQNSALAYTDPASGDPAVLIRLADGRHVSFDAVCTHAGCTVPYNPARQLLICPCHGATYDPARGAKVISGPAPQPLTSLPIRLDSGGNVYALDAKPGPGKPTARLHAPPPPTSGGDDGTGDNEGTRRRGGSRRHDH